ncbi:hypothetical protein V8G54_007234 [Vigna mungo]|uniref:Uncharacterized protein n=1 Tax=Vigna mungo TaxID=3915 RepID=A0AAQ3P3M4_VIGMU
MTVISHKQKVALRDAYKNKKYLSLDLRPKKTKAIRRRLTTHQAQEWAAVVGSQATTFATQFHGGTLPTILVIEFLDISFVEQQRSMEKDLEKKKYPGGVFYPLGTMEKGKYSFG